MSLVSLPRGGPGAPDPAEAHGLDANTVGLWRLESDGLDLGPNNLDLDENGSAIFDEYHPRGKVTIGCHVPTFTDFYSLTDPLLRISGALTIMLLVRQNWSTSGFQSMVECGGNDEAVGNNYQYLFRLNGSRQINFLQEYAGASNSETTTTTALAVNRWYHLAVTRDAAGTDVNIYIDGALDKNATLTAPTGGSTSSFRLAGYGANTDLDGVMRDCHVLDREMTPGEVSAIASRIVGDF